VPVGLDIGPADELVYVLCEIMRLEAEWIDYREIYLARYDFDLDKLLSLLPEGGYIEEKHLLHFCSKLQMTPSERQSKLFMKRFGLDGKVETSVMRSLISANDERTNKVAKLKDGMSPETYEAVGLWLKCLFRCLLAQNELKSKLKERNINVPDAFRYFGEQLVSENAFRDRLLERNVIPRSRDIQNLLRMISKEDVSAFTLGQLEAFLQPVVFGIN
jgi:hypothetical protein